MTGIEVENRNVAAYAEAIKKLASDAQLRKTYGENAKRRVEELFTNEKFTQNVNDLLESL